MRAHLKANVFEHLVITDEEPRFNSSIYPHSLIPNITGKQRMKRMVRMGEILVLILTLQVAYATSRGGGTLGQVKCNCPPVGGGAGGGIGGGVGSPPVGGGSGGGIGGGIGGPPVGGGISSPPVGGGIGSPPVGGGIGSPPVGGGIGSPPVGTGPVYSSPPPATPSLTPPYGGTSPPSTPRFTPRRSPPSPSGGGSSSTPTTPSVPPYGGSVSPPSPPSSSSPTVPSYGTPPVPPPSSSSSPPVVGAIPPPSTDPGVPSTPGGSTPTLPGFPPLGIIPGLPGSGTGTCNFWGSHPWLLAKIPSILSSIADLFGSGPLFPSSLGKGMTVEEALRNRRRDGYGTLLREGTASLLNSFVNPAFQYAPQQVKNHFNAALRSNRAAAVQGAKFKSANEGRLH